MGVRRVEILSEEVLECSPTLFDLDQSNLFRCVEARHDRSGLGSM